MEYTDIEFDQVRAWIRKKRENASKSFSWDDLLLACKKTEAELSAFLETRADEDDWPVMSVEDWKAIVMQQKQAEEETIRFGIESGAAIIHGDNQSNTVSISQDKHSSWQTYKKGLLDNGFKQDTVTEIERATLNILRRLSLNTTETGPVKGLVIGNVQSGKTANMAALMAMAADCGWNMFIVLSGTIDNLRKQTEERLFGDLHRPVCHIDWVALDHPSSRDPKILKANAMRFGERNHSYFTVCLKNKARLKELMLWLQEDRNVQAQMKVMVIDDEADQAGINTADVDSNERKAINALIRNLVNGKTWDTGDCPGNYQAMNYIGYTATPYANVLNESGYDSLYPKDFIATLGVSDEYFGPQQIFGCEDTGYEGIDLVRIIPDSDLEAVRHLQKDANGTLPQSMMDSICWFLCGVACMRYWGYRKPISMLIHTSQNTTHHTNVANAVEKWITNISTDELVSECRKIWSAESTKLSLEDFLNQYPDYGISPDLIKDYPGFNDIRGELIRLLSGTRISNIPMSDRKKPRYHDGIHLCVDNCKNNGVANDMMVRLLYPDKKDMPSPAPAFIVIGGATLSRGLTLEGLISTFFMRTVKQSDTLMQMGRWFGYRKGYELIPRLWLSSNTETQFRFLSLLDQRLRDEIHFMDTFGISPSKYGPRVMNSPRMSFIRIVAKNRMQKAQDTDRDFSGASSQTQLFDNDQGVLTSNLDCTRRFLLELGDPVIQKPVNTHAENSKIWRNVSFEFVSKYLKKYKFQERQTAFKDLDAMLEWIQKMTDENSIGNWNVVLAGISEKSSSGGYWELSPNVGVYKVTRAQKTKNKDDKILDIGALRVPKDIIADIDLDTVSDPSVKERVKHFASKYAFELREKAGLSKTPQLLIYVVDKDSKPPKNNKDRCALNAKEDVIGLSLTIPGESKYSGNVATVSVLIEEIGINETKPDITDED